MLKSQSGLKDLWRHETQSRVAVLVGATAMPFDRSTAGVIQTASMLPTSLSKMGANGSELVTISLGPHRAQLARLRAAQAFGQALLVDAERTVRGRPRTAAKAFTPWFTPHGAAKKNGLLHFC